MRWAGVVAPIVMGAVACAPASDGAPASGVAGDAPNGAPSAEPTGAPGPLVCWELVERTSSMGPPAREVTVRDSLGRPRWWALDESADGSWDRVHLRTLDAAGRDDVVWRLDEPGFDRHTYNAAGRLVRVEHERLGPPAARRTSVQRYDAAGLLVAREHGSTRDELHHDDAGRLVEQRTLGASGVLAIERWQRDAAGRLVESRFAQEHREETLADPDWLVERHQYDDAGRLVAVESRRGETLVARTETSYDAAGHATTVRHLDRHGVVTQLVQHTHDALGRVTSVDSRDPRRAGWTRERRTHDCGAFVRSPIALPRTRTPGAR